MNNVCPLWKKPARISAWSNSLSQNTTGSSAVEDGWMPFLHKENPDYHTTLASRLLFAIPSWVSEICEDQYILTYRSSGQHRRMDTAIFESITLSSPDHHSGRKMFVVSLYGLILGSHPSSSNQTTNKSSVYLQILQASDQKVLASRRILSDETSTQTLQQLANANRTNPVEFGIDCTEFQDLPIQLAILIECQRKSIFSFFIFQARMIEEHGELALAGCRLFWNPSTRSVTGHLETSEMQINEVSPWKWEIRSIKPEEEEENTSASPITTVDVIMEATADGWELQYTIPNELGWTSTTTDGRHPNRMVEIRIVDPTHPEVATPWIACDPEQVGPLYTLSPLDANIKVKVEPGGAFSAGTAWFIGTNTRSGWPAISTHPFHFYSKFPTDAVAMVTPLGTAAAAVTTPTTAWIEWTAEDDDGRSGLVLPPRTAVTSENVLALSISVYFRGMPSNSVSSAIITLTNPMDEEEPPIRFDLLQKARYSNLLDSASMDNPSLLAFPMFQHQHPRNQKQYTVRLTVCFATSTTTTSTPSSDAFFSFSGLCLVESRPISLSDSSACIGFRTIVSSGTPSGTNTPPPQQQFLCATLRRRNSLQMKSAVSPAIVTGLEQVHAVIEPITTTTARRGGECVIIVPLHIDSHNYARGDAIFTTPVDALVAALRSEPGDYHISVCFADSQIHQRRQKLRVETDTSPAHRATATASVGTICLHLGFRSSASPSPALLPSSTTSIDQRILNHAYRFRLPLTPDPNIAAVLFYSITAARPGENPIQTLGHSTDTAAAAATPPFPYSIETAEVPQQLHSRIARWIQVIGIVILAAFLGTLIYYCVKRMMVLYHPRTSQLT